ncbi:ribosomal RNA-processing protein 7-domain-containing protein [Protomyces lactucae-debilis]|uniref:Ribosomal RNA-processing protein 7-domain-containing protein n=1 Tax=Protomyces lactucae-debilis TaxID=2754530 RepID=A0A1Y2FAV4_PROLT|nr:ribosomal RNA-processing protein 7-domain-containing protein [Protomyces lactucae-debilis]ORY81023.1 ribosomal RNA-processing protein 7-domain-containing protein [Protomyces lactucae-debilis]
MAMPFITLSVQTPASSFSDGATQHIFMRQNVPKPPLQDDGRMLFMANLPSDTTETHLRRLVTVLGGRVESVRFLRQCGVSLSLEDVALQLDEITDQDFSAEVQRLKVASALPAISSRTLRATGSSAHVALVEPQELKRVLKNARQASALSWEAPDEPELGRNLYKSNLSLKFPDPIILQQSVDAYMELFNQEEILRRRKQKRMRSEADEDGFITITRGGRTGAGRAFNAVQQLSAKQQNKVGVLDDLYKFQRKDVQKQKREETRSKFEQDKRRVAELRERRKFRPL